MSKSTEKEIDEYKVHKDKLKILFKGIYGFSTIEFRKYNKSPTIGIGSGEGLAHTFKLKTGKRQKTSKYLENLSELFKCTFIDDTAQFDHGNLPSDDIRKDVFKNTLIYFIGEEVVSSILNTCLEDIKLSRRRYIPTDESIFDVMNNYERYQGVPMICTSEKLQAFKDVYENQYDTDISDTLSNTEIMDITFEEFCRKYQDVMECLGKFIYELLVDIMIPVFSKENVSEEELDADYNKAYERIKSDMTKKFETEVRKELCLNKNFDNIKKIILIEKDCEIDDLKKVVLYYPDCSPVLSEWKIPVHQYKKYHAQSYTSEEIMEVLIHPARLNSSCCPLGDLQIDKQMINYPISNIKIPYNQNMFNGFQIQYWTSGKQFQRNDLFLQYNPDIIISYEIKTRWKDQIIKYWECIFASINDILQKLFSIDFIKLIEEAPLENDGLIYDQYLDVFLQEDALMLDDNILSEFLTKELIQRHYFFQQIKSPDYADFYGGDYVSQFSMKQAAYILIPLIGRFISELKNVIYNIAGVIGDIATKKEFDSHVKRIIQYLEGDKLSSAINAWDRAYSSRKKYELQEKRRSIRGGSMIYPDYRMLGLMKYAEEKGNLFLNLKNVLEEYLYCLRELA